MNVTMTVSEHVRVTIKENSTFAKEEWTKVLSHMHIIAPDVLSY